MPTYAIGDVQGCYKTLTALLKRIRFDPASDRLWLVGDLVNRGPGSLEVLRWARGVGAPLTTVLGNHDLHLLAVAAGARKNKARDTLAPILEANDRDELIDWLRHQPLLHAEGEHVLVHAGLLPAWTVEEAAAEARAIEAELRGDDWQAFMQALYGGDAPSAWSPTLNGHDRQRFAVAVFTRMRMCDPDGSLDTDYKGAPLTAPAHLIPWFAHPDRASTGSTIVFGHWAALGLHLEDGIAALDSGCVWGRSLTAFRLEDTFLFQEPLCD